MTADKRLGETAHHIIAESEIMASTASLWEMALKNAKSKLPLPQGSIIEGLEAQGFILLPILPRHIEAVRRLDCVHSDPFDRLLIAQALDGQLTLLTRDAAILALGIDSVMAG